MNTLPFYSRNNIGQSAWITDDFPTDSRRAIYIVLMEFISMGYIGAWETLYKELCRTCRSDIDRSISAKQYEVTFMNTFYEIPWKYIYVFIERVFDVHLHEVLEYDRNGEVCGCIIEKKDVLARFTKEVNNILLEDNIAFEFIDGVFFRRGRLITQKNTARVGGVLNDKNLAKAKFHYQKALRFFHDKDCPDHQNTIKEAICALELAIDVITGLEISKDFSQHLKKLEGNDKGKIPSPIIQSMIKIYGYRNSGEGVSHGIQNGLRVSGLESELILNFVASLITYFYDYFYECQQEEELPF